jgi:hypothetical protein
MADVRLIDANALKKEMVEVEIVTPPHNHHCSELVVFGYDIDDAPTIDAAPVVRCRECVHYKHKDAMTPGDNRMRCDHPCLDYDIECYDQWLDVEPDDYCKYGERKMDGGAENV